MNESWEQDEFKALEEFCATNQLTYEVIALSFFTKTSCGEVSWYITPHQVHPDLYTPAGDHGDLPRGVALLVAPNSPLTDCVTLGNA